MFWSTTYTTLNQEFYEAANMVGVDVDEGSPFAALFGNGGNYTLDRPENNPEFFSYLMGGNLDNEAAAAAWYRR